MEVVSVNNGHPLAVGAADDPTPPDPGASTVGPKNRR